MDISDRLSSIYTGDHPEPDWWICSFKTPNIRGCDGPQMSMSRTAKFLSGFRSAIVRANIEVTVLLPTPPFPDTTNSLFLTSAKRSFTNSMAGSGPFVAPDAHRFWFGQPAHADVLPAASLSVPGQCSAAFSGMSDIMRMWDDSFSFGCGIYMNWLWHKKSKRKNLFAIELKHSCFDRRIVWILSMVFWLNVMVGAHARYLSYLLGIICLWEKCHRNCEIV